MFIAALVVGLITAYYLGLRAGGYAAAAAAGLFFVASVIPAISVGVYVLVAVGLVGLFTVGPRMQSSGTRRTNRQVVAVVRRVVGRLWKLGGR
jgi:ABC-type spermidine/putrescine transport system permease subunit II